MSVDESPSRSERPEQAEAAVGWPFGPAFFLGQLPGLVRNRCPNPEEHLPAVELQLADGCRMELCHIIGVASRWIAVAAFEGGRSGSGQRAMVTELVPYGLVMRVSIRVSRKEPGRMGFETAHEPTLWETADSDPQASERALAAVAHVATQSPQEPRPDVGPSA